ncbi:MAG: hypothetical protein AB1437_05840 [Pseudomonadota bacterium]
MNVLTPLHFANCLTEGIFVPVPSWRSFTIVEMAATICSTRLPRLALSMESVGHVIPGAAKGISQGNSSVKTACSIITAPRQRAATVQVGLPVRLACFYLGVSVPVLPC